MKSIEITEPNGRAIIIELPLNDPCLDALREAVMAHSLPTEGTKYLTFAAQSDHSPSFEEVYTVCSAVVAVFGEPLVWEIQPMGDTPADFDARLSVAPRSR